MSLRLPGLAFESAPVALDERLPRMDIALFVGFARRGPIDRPVLCEDYAAFTSVFGPEHDLFIDAGSGAPVTAQLAPAVQSFFANGGRRCWVVRVALRPVTAKLPLAGLWVETKLGWHAVQARAASGGRWGFGLRAGVRLERAALGVLSAGNPWDGQAPHRIALDPASTAQPEAGDLLRFVSDAPDAAVATDFSRVVAFLRVASVLKRNDGQHRTRVDARIAESWWFGVPKVMPARFDGSLALPRARSVTVRFVADDQAAAPLPIGPEWCGVLRIELPATLRSADWPQAGHPLRLRAGARVFLATLGDCVLAARDASTVTIKAQVALLEQLPAPCALNDEPLGERLRITLMSDDELEGARTLADIGLCPGHARAWQALPRDDARWSADPAHEVVIPAKHAALWAEARTNAFPIAGRGLGDCLPIGLPWAAPSWIDALQDARNSMARDGLRRLSAALFLDPRLADASMHTLVARAEALRFPVDPARMPARSVRGVHSLLALEEATLLAAPDLALPPWRPAQAASWPAPAPSDPVAVPAGPCGAALPFAACVPVRVAPPLLTIAVDGESRLTAQWTADPVADQFVLEGARHPDWQDAVVLYQGGDTRWPFDSEPTPWRYLRVRVAAPGCYSDWSRGGSVPQAQTAGWAAQPDAPEGLRTVLRVQRAMLRIAAARADSLAVLGAPAWMDNADAQRHIAALSRHGPGGDESMLGDDEVAALSYAAIYHPWLRRRRADGVVAFAPEGAACGLIARRALSRGAWIAAANEVVTDAIGLERPPADPLRLFFAGANLWRYDGLRVRLMGARTLSLDPDWVPLNVRRLMSLLRRLLIREGNVWVFEPNGAALERSVERGLTAWLTQLHARGAFAGRKPAEAWQLTLNPGQQRDRDDGRFVVELRFAPATPLEFLTVRLVRNGDALRVEGA